MCHLTHRFHHPSTNYHSRPQNNVLISDDGVAKLAAFGLSALLVEHSGSFTYSTDARGTARWMAPELLDSADPRVSYESDIWACGCLLIEVSTLSLEPRPVRSYTIPKVQSGKAPYSDLVNDMQIIKALGAKKLPHREAGISAALWEIICRCCKIEPGQRIRLRPLRHDVLQLLVMERVQFIVRGHDTR